MQMPTTRNEEYRYTDLSPLLKLQLQVREGGRLLPGYGTNFLSGLCCWCMMARQYVGGAALQGAPGRSAFSTLALAPCSSVHGI